MYRRSKNSSVDWQLPDRMKELDRLVDGRLSDEKYRELLCQIDADPDGWKQCALAFLEHQALEKELGAFANDPTCQMLPCMGAIVAETNSAMAGVEKVELKSNSWGMSKAGAIIGWATMSLSIIGGLALGFTLQSNFRDRLEARVADQNDSRTLSNSGAMANMTPLVDRSQSGDSQQGKQNCKTRRSCCSQKHRVSLQNRDQIQKQTDSWSQVCPVAESLIEEGEK